jgi:hypothetical protein
MVVIAYIFIGLCVVGAVAWWISVIYALAVATKQESDEGTLTWVHGAMWSFFITCIAIGLIRGCE